MIFDSALRLLLDLQASAPENLGVLPPVLLPLGVEGGGRSEGVARAVGVVGARAVAVESYGLGGRTLGNRLNDDGPHCPRRCRGRWSCGWCVDGISGQFSVE